MSTFVKDGQVTTYAVVDPGAQMVLSVHFGVGEAIRARKWQQSSSGDELVLHNITHSKCPEWLKELVLADGEYCNAQVTRAEKSAATLRRKADELVSQAEDYDRRANTWRERAEAAAALSGPAI